MNIKKHIDRVYQAIKDIKYPMFFIAYSLICIMVVIVLSIVSELLIESYNIWELVLRFELGLPLILQLVLTYIVYRENHENRIIKILFIVVFFYTLVCGILSLYELYYTYPSFGDDLILYVVCAQMVFQVILSLMLIISFKLKLVDKGTIIKPLLMVSFTMVIVLLMEFDKNFDNDLMFGIIITTLFINIFNPVLLYILSYTAKGKLFIKDNQYRVLKLGENDHRDSSDDYT